MILQILLDLMLGISLWKIRHRGGGQKRSVRRLRCPPLLTARLPELEAFQRRRKKYRAILPHNRPEHRLTHPDVLDWLEPDWIFDTKDGKGGAGFETSVRAQHAVFQAPR
jgi:hypothetical protein